MAKELDTQSEAISLLKSDNQTKRDEIETLFVITYPNTLVTPLFSKNGRSCS